MKNNRTTVSLVILVHNVKDHIELCLKSACQLENSIVPLIDEVIFVDHNSTDGTINKAIDYLSSLNIKHSIAHYTGKFEFDKARNMGIALCNSKVILMLDADERLVITHEELFRQFIDNVSHGWTAGIMATKNPTTQYDGSTDFIASGMRRIFPNDVSYFYKTPIHEVLQHPPDALMVAVPGAYIAHLGYDMFLKEIGEKYDRNMKGLVSEIDRDITNGVTWYFIGNTLGLKGKFIEQKQAYALALVHGKLGIGIGNYIKEKLEYLEQNLINQRYLKETL
ncbi:hypothetical protein LCGC14_0342060 [marine sediment metagenome]|uniref:Glycosyltransferase 2-like domain-containing protein n=1 Tax=marine sediment metagenome TaxID=412755 RepID=A0A0F9TIU9_9ZZZZ